MSIALLTAFNFGVNLTKQGMQWRLLSTQIMRFNKGFCSPEDLIRTYEQEERLIGDVLYRGMSMIKNVLFCLGIQIFCQMLIRPIIRMIQQMIMTVAILVRLKFQTSG